MLLPKGTVSRHRRLLMAALAVIGLVEFNHRDNLTLRRLSLGTLPRCDEPVARSVHFLEPSYGNAQSSLTAEKKVLADKGQNSVI